ncbi:MAG: SDR family NAD(P)-dependent oxidoreductase [Motilibacteraceae bacterium]
MSQSLVGKTAVVTGGINGIGAATALRLRALGGRVVIIGRSAAKAQDLVARSAAMPEPGSLEAVVADFSLMRNVEAAVDELAGKVGRIDYLVHAVGIFLTRPEHTAEGLEKDFAVSYLSRFVFLEAAARHGLLSADTRMVNLAASTPRMPKRARVEFDDLAEVTARTGFESHSQAQTANDLLTAQAGERYGISALGYGPGNADTGILRELPWTTRLLFFPFTRNKRSPQQVADQLVGLLTDGHWSPSAAGFATKKGRFPAAAFVADRRRQEQVLAVSTALTERALTA